MLFQGQEFASSRPFLYFADHEPALAAKVATGRAEFLAQFPSLTDPAVTRALRDPAADDTFARSVLDLRERETHAPVVALHRDLLRLRRETAAFRAQAARGVDGAVLGPEAFVLRYFDGSPGRRHDQADPRSGDRLVLVNLGRDLDLDAAPEPLLAPPGGCRWAVEWSSESREYDGSGTPPIEDETRGWHLPGHAAIVLRPVPRATRAADARRPERRGKRPCPIHHPARLRRLAPQRVPLLRRMPWPGAAAAAEQERLLTREWLVTNGLGGYASGTVSGVMTRRYHGLLVAALPAPFGRVVMLNHLAEHLRLPDGRKIALGGEERVGSSPELHGAQYLSEFRLEAGLPVWQFDLGGWTIEKRLLLPHQQNTVHITYVLLAGDGPVRLDLRPSLHFRHHEAPVSLPLDKPYAVTVVDDRYEIAGDGVPPLRLLVCGERGSLHDPAAPRAAGALPHGGVAGVRVGGRVVEPGPFPRVAGA